MKSSKPSEDLQPNEIRMARKGAAVIPIIRTVASTSRGTFRGMARGRGRPAPPFRPPAQLRRGKPFHTAGTSAASGASWQKYPNNSTTNKRPGNAPDEGRPWKRPRNDEAMSLPMLQASSVVGTNRALGHDTPRTLPNVLKRHIPSKPKDPLEIISVELPQNCRKGAPRSQGARRSWFRRQTASLKTDQGLEVVKHSYVNSNLVHFECLRTGPQDEIVKDSSSVEDADNHASPLEVEDEDRGTSETPHIVTESYKRNDVGAAQSPLHSRSSTPLSTCSSLSPTPLLQEKPVSPYRSIIDITLGQVPNRKSSNIPQPVVLSVQDVKSEEFHLEKPGVSISISRPTPSSFIELPNTRLPSHMPLGQSGRPSDNLGYRRRMHVPVFHSGTLLLSPPTTPAVFPSLPRSHSKANNKPYEADSSATQLDESVLADTTESEELYHQPNPILSDSNAVEEDAHASSVGIVEDAQLSGSEMPDDDDDQLSAILIDCPDEVVQFPKDPYDKSRCLITTANGVASVTMHGYIDLVNTSPPRRRHTLKAVPEASQGMVDDACLLESPSGFLIVLGHARDTHPISIIGLDKERQVGSFDRPAHGEKKGGVSAVCAMMQPNMFATGGYDRTVHLWDVNEDGSRASSQLLAIKHTSLVQSLLSVHDTSHKLITTSADCGVNVWDLSSERVVNTMKTSTSVYHVHQVSSPSCVLLEVAHRELQFEIRDYRSTPEKPVLRFGFNTSKFQGRYVKGAVKDNAFACGDKDGVVRIWDLRLTKETPRIVECFPGRKALQVVFSGGEIIACSEDHRVAFFKHNNSDAL